MKAIGLFWVFVLLCSTLVAADVLEVTTNAAVCFDSTAEVTLRVFKDTPGSERFVFSTTGGRLRSGAVTLKENQQTFIVLEAIPSEGPIKVTAVGPKTTLSTDITVLSKNCGDVRIVAEDQELCANEESTFSLQVSNPGEDVVEGLLEFSSIFESQNVTVQPQANVDIPLTFTSDMNDKRIEVTLTMGSTVHRETFWLRPVSPNKCTRLEVSPRRISLLGNETTTHLDLYNAGVRTGTYTLALQGDPYITLPQGSIVLEPGEEKELTLALAFTEESRSSDFQLIAKEGETTYTHDFAVSIGLHPVLAFAAKRADTAFIGLVILIFVYILWNVLKSRSFRMPNIQIASIERQNVTKNAVSASTSTSKTSKLGSFSGGRWSQRYQAIDFDNPALDTDFIFTKPWTATFKKKMTLGVLFFVLVGSSISTLILGEKYIAWALFIVVICIVLVLLASILRKATASYTRHRSSDDHQLVSDNQQLASDNQHLASDNQHLASDNQYLASDNQYLASDSHTLVSDGHQEVMGTHHTVMGTESTGVADAFSHTTVSAKWSSQSMGAPYWKVRRWMSVALFMFMSGVVAGSWGDYSKKLVLAILGVVAFVVVIILIPPNLLEKLDKYFFIEKK